MFKDCFNLSAFTLDMKRGISYTWNTYDLLIFKKNRLLSGINTSKLERFILECQDDEDGGISDRPGNMTDIFHLFFGLAALSLIDHAKYDLELVDPLFAIPKRITGDLRNRLGRELCSNEEMIPKEVGETGVEELGPGVKEKELETASEEVGSEQKSDN